MRYIEYELPHGSGSLATSYLALLDVESVTISIQASAAGSVQVDVFSNGFSFYVNTISFSATGVTLMTFCRIPSALGQYPIGNLMSWQQVSGTTLAVRAILAIP